MTSRIAQPHTTALDPATTIDRVARLISIPKLDQPDSFELHAPLELLARVALLARASAGDRDAIVRRIDWLGETYATASAPVDTAAELTAADDDPVTLTVAASDTSTEPWTALRTAIAAGDVDQVDRLSGPLLAQSSLATIAHELADDMIPRLSAAGHGPIFLTLLSALGAQTGPNELTATQLAALRRTGRSLLHELARFPDIRLSWFDRATDPDHPDDRDGSVDDGSALLAALLHPPSPGPLDNNFIYPTMSLTERSGLAESTLRSPLREIDPSTAAHVLARVAAMSMLQSSPAEAPYGWTHCLTMSQAVMNSVAYVSEPRRARAVAATYVLGFRATLSDTAIDPQWVPTPSPAVDDPTCDLFDLSPDDAAARVWALAASPAAEPATSPAAHPAGDTVAATITQLVGHAGVHHDAHLAKYTLSCLLAAEADPEYAHLYLAAAAYLNVLWHQTEPARLGDLAVAT